MHGAGACIVCPSACNNVKAVNAVNAIKAVNADINVDVNTSLPLAAAEPAFSPFCCAVSWAISAGRQFGLLLVRLTGTDRHACLGAALLTDARAFRKVSIHLDGAQSVGAFL